MGRSGVGCLIIVTGLPATGKSLLAVELARSLDLALLAKDAIKEPLLDALGAGDASHSRRLSDGSFALQFLLAGKLLHSDRSVLLEGNFRPGEHESALRPQLPDGTRVAQVLCQVEEDLRRQRLQKRRCDVSRHPGHGDAVQPLPGATTNGFLDLAGPRWSHRGQAPRRERRALAEALADWMGLPGGSRD
jgi:predicted kinase